jgi:hypothetical protein
MMDTTMIYFLLGLVALIFALLGFLVHAFYFGTENLTKSLGKENQLLRQKLKDREEENAGAREEIAITRILLQSLERQLEEKREQADSLQNLALQQQDTILLLQNNGSSAIHFANGAERAESPKENPMPVYASQAKGQAASLWKDNLDNVLEVLNKIENGGK